MELWHGDVTSDGPETRLRDVHLYGSCRLPQNATLKWLAVVNVCNIPLYFAVGTPLDVWTSSPETQNILNNVLLETGDDDDKDELNERLPWWERLQRQSDLGILVRIEPCSDGNEAELSPSRVTELLLYAAAPPKLQTGRLHTPSRSSSPGPGQFEANRADDPNWQLQLYALPICRNFSHEQTYGEPAKHPEQGKAYFLPTPNQAADSIRQIPSAKRRKISNVFENATQQRRKLKGHGGERISKTMAERAATPLSLPALEKASSVSEQPCESVQTTDPRKRSLSRASSMASLPSVEPSRPPSRRESFAPNKRSSLHRVESVLSGARSPSITTDGDNSIEKQNKQALSRIVMAGMRMYGLQQTKKSANTANRITEGSSEQDGEYKLIYHQTFRAASFAFRTHLAVKQVPQNTLREVVDRLLSMFCNDPLAESKIEEDVDRSFGSQKLEQRRNPFDEPTSSAGIVETVTPLHRKEKHNRRIFE